MIKQSPPEIQYRFRKLENGKYFFRLEDNINAKLVESGEYTGVEVRKIRRDDGSFEYKDVTAEYATIINSKEGQEHLKKLESYYKKKVLTKARAQDLYRALSAISDDKLLQALVRQLDRERIIQKLFNRLPDALVPIPLFGDYLSVVLRRPA